MFVALFDFWKIFVAEQGSTGYRQLYGNYMIDFAKNVINERHCTYRKERHKLKKIP